MYLCDIPEDAMNQLHLPNGVPLVYNVKRKCITLLDDGSGVDPMEKYDFGPAAQYLFRPCELGDDFFDQVSSYIRVFIVIRKNAALTCDIDGATGHSKSSRKNTTYGEITGNRTSGCITLGGSAATCNSSVMMCCFFFLTPHIGHR